MATGEVQRVRVVVPKGVNTKGMGLACLVNIVALQVFLGDWSPDVSLGSFA